MIIYHQTNIAAFKGNHVIYWIGSIRRRISVTSAVAAVTLPVGSLAMMGMGT